MHCILDQDVSHNQLTSLPCGIGFLVRLTNLTASHNKLVDLPNDIVNMRGKSALLLKNPNRSIFLIQLQEKPNGMGEAAYNTVILIHVFPCTSSTLVYHWHHQLSPSRGK